MSSVTAFIYYNDGKPHKTVQVAGEFSDWEPVALACPSVEASKAAKSPESPKTDDTQYSVEIKDLQKGQRYMYKFIVDGQWLLASDSRETQDDGHGNLNHVLVASSKIEQNEYDHLKTGYPTPSYNTFTDHPNQGQPGAPNGAGNGVVAVADRKDNDRYLVTRMVCAMFSGFSFMLRSVFCGCCASSNSRSCH